MLRVYMDRYPLLFYTALGRIVWSAAVFIPGSASCCLLSIGRPFFFLDTMHLYYPLVSLTLTAFVCWAGRFSSDV
jgi:hypothetical protein